MDAAPSAAPPFDVPEELRPLLVSRQAFLRQHAGYQRLVVGALVFHRDRLLLVQRAATERAYPLVWEAPGGSCELDDDTVLHGAARELREEAGLRVRRFVRLVDEMDFVIARSYGDEYWVKLSFEVEVERDERPHAHRDRNEVEEEEEDSAPSVRLDPIEHQDYVWVSEEQLKQGKVDDIHLKFLNDRNRSIYLSAFALRAQRST